MSVPARLVVDASRPAASALETAASLLRARALVAFPTETFYGLGANALDETAVARVFHAKGRPADKPLLVLVDSQEMVARVARDVPALARRLMARYWPGALTLVLRAHADLPGALTAGTGTIAVRLPGHPVARALVSALGGPVTAPSANPHGKASPRTADEVIAGLGDRVDRPGRARRPAAGLDSSISPTPPRCPRARRARFPRISRG